MVTGLVAEDTSANMMLTPLLQHSAGRNVYSALHAEMGLRLAHDERSDLMLVDIQLPDMDGLAMTAILKPDPVTAHIPIVALSALAMKADEKWSSGAGCDAYIVKPVRCSAMDDLLAEPQPSVNQTMSAGLPTP